jgi:hypothetical protein
MAGLFQDHSGGGNGDNGVDSGDDQRVPILQTAHDGVAHGDQRRCNMVSYKSSRSTQNQILLMPRLHITAVTN